MPSKSYAVEERYFRWLYSKIGSLNDTNPKHSHWLLAEVLHNRAFESFVDNDENRESDGTAFREVFCDEEGYEWGNSRFVFEPCTMLELMLGLAKHLDFMEPGSEIDDTGIGVWFWRLAANAGLNHLSDDYCAGIPRATDFINAVCDRIIYRRYSADGQGSFFPMVDPPSDARQMELWYQMNEYMIELM